MFEEFEKGSHRSENRRFGASVAVSALLYSALGGGIIAASAAARSAVQEEDLTQVEFALPEEPEPPPPPPTEAPPPPKPKPKAEMAPPEEIPDEKPAEAEGPLADAPAPGPEDAVAPEPEPAPQVVEPPPPPPRPKTEGPVQLPENATPPVPMAGNAAPAYPEEARKAGMHGDVIAKLVIGEDGTVKSVDILRGPDVFHAAVKQALLQWRFEPARLPDGTAIAVFKLVKVPFKLENM